MASGPLPAGDGRGVSSELAVVLLLAVTIVVAILVYLFALSFL